MESKKEGNMIAELLNRNNIILEAYRKYTEGKMSGTTYDEIFNYHKEHIDRIIEEMRVQHEE